MIYKGGERMQRMERQLMLIIGLSFTLKDKEILMITDYHKYN